MNYITRKFLEHLFGENKINSFSPIVGVRKNKRVSYFKFGIKGLNQKDAVSVLCKLRKKKLLEYREVGGGKIIIILTEDGKKKVLAYKLDEMEIKKPRQWNGKWHIIAFDIPEKHKSARNALADKMRELGLVLFQKSLWIYPFYCKDEMDFVAEVFNVGKYVHYITVESITIVLIIICVVLRYITLFNLNVKFYYGLKIAIIKPYDFQRRSKTYCRVGQD